MATDPGLERLREAYERTHARLWRAVLGWAGSAEVADEACAEAFAQAARRGDAVRDVDAWVWRAAFRIAAGELKRRRQRATPVGAAVDLLGVGPGGHPSADSGTHVTGGADGAEAPDRPGGAGPYPGGRRPGDADGGRGASRWARAPVDADLPEAGIDLLRALRQLSDQQRACVVLRDVAGLTAPETAAVLGTTAATVRVQTMRGHRRLRRILEDGDD